MTENVRILQETITALQKKFEKAEFMNKQLNSKMSELDSLYQIGCALSTTFELDEVLRSIKDVFCQNFTFDRYSILLYDEEAGLLRVASSHGLHKSVQDNFVQDTDDNIFYNTIENGETVYYSDLSTSPRFKFYNNGHVHEKGSLICMPLKPDHSCTLGVVSIYSETLNAFSQEDIVSMERIASHVSNVLDKILIFKHTKELSITDDLTGLYNRRYLNQRFEREVLRAKRYKRPLSVIMIDIDYFKNYNDSNGHILGDEVLKKVSHLMESNIRKADILARYGGEEFILLLPEIDKEHANTVAEKLRQTIEVSHFPGEEDLPNHRLTISLGISTLLNDTHHAQELVDLADKALYKAKRDGRNRVVSYSPDISDSEQKEYYYANTAI